VPITLALSTPTPGVSIISPQTFNRLASASASAFRPTITDHRLIIDGKHVTGIALTFNKPMNVASGEDLRNYSFRVNRE
jgi:hypothetical protein